MKTFPLLVSAIWMTMTLSGHARAAATVEDAVLDLQTEWAEAKYKTSPERQDQAFAALTEKARGVVEQFPDRAEPLIWKAIIVSSHAGATGGLSALSKVKTARALLEQAEKIDPKALDGSIYTSLGSLYYQVPGWPVGFGNDRKAEEYLKKAIALNPDGIDPNYFYGDYLREQERYSESSVYLKKALEAPDRPGRAAADEGRREEVRKALESVEAKLVRK